jgi:L-lactate dehydrogenase complex protein LldG
MSTRDIVLGAVRRNQPAARALPELPSFPRPHGDLLSAFTAALERMGGSVVTPPARMPIERVVKDQFPQARVICSATLEVHGTRELAAVRDARELQDVDVGVVRARFGIAETGSVWLSERELHVNALAFLSQHLVVLLDPSAILPGLQDAYREPCFAQARYSVLLTGPSATADIEGVLVRGAQGVRSLTVLLAACGPER